MSVEVTRGNLDITVTVREGDGICECGLATLLEQGMYNTGLDKVYTIMSLKTDREHLGQGLATQALKELCTLADEERFAIELAANPYYNYHDKALNDKALVAFFEKFGFVHWEDSKIIMVRKPQ